MIIPMKTSELLEFLQGVAPTDLAEEWDNVGLLIGSSHGEVARVMTCLTLTADVAREAIEARADLVVTHHPLLFRSIKRITDDTLQGRLLLELIQAEVRVYSPHTGYDSAREGINQQLALALELENVRPLRVTDDQQPERGAGRAGDLRDAITLEVLVERVKRALGVRHTWFVGDPTREIARVGIACGAADEFANDALRAGCEALLLGEARFHTCLDARANELALILPGHYATERPAMENLAERLRDRFGTLHVWASEVESDPIDWA